MYTVTTKASVTMIQDDAVGSPNLGADNRNVFGDTRKLDVSSLPEISTDIETFLVAYYMTGNRSQ